jgi:hypothetical protein
VGWRQCLLVKPYSEQHLLDTLRGTGRLKLSSE